MLLGKRAGPAAPSVSFLPVRTVKMPLAEDGGFIAFALQYLRNGDLTIVEKEFLVFGLVVDVLIDIAAGRRASG